MAVATSLTAALFLLLAVGAVAAGARTDPPAPSLVLEELLNGQVVCTSAEGTCTAVNLYGPGGNTNPPPINPGDVRVATVQFRNAGTLPASSLVLSPGACMNQNLSTGGAASGDLCSVLTVAIACTTGSTTFSFGPETLTRFGQAGVLTVNSGMAVGEVATCRFTTTYPSTAPFLPSLRAVQPITKTITAGPVPPPPPPPPTTAPPTTAPPTTAPPITAPPSVVPPVTSPPSVPPSAVSPIVPPSVVSPSAPPSQVSAAPTPPSRLAFTGGDALPLALTGLALLLLGGLLYWLSRRRDEGEPNVSPPAA